MSLSSKDRIKSVHLRNAQDRSVEELRAWENCIIGEVKKKGRKNVLKYESENKNYWLKKQYEKLVDYAHEVRLKRIPFEVKDPDGALKPKVDVSITNVYNTGSSKKGISGQEGRQAVSGNIIKREAISLLGVEA